MQEHHSRRCTRAPLSRFGALATNWGLPITLDIISDETATAAFRDFYYSRNAYLDLALPTLVATLAPPFASHSYHPASLTVVGRMITSENQIS
jgi:hypothetical protein